MELPSTRKMMEQVRHLPYKPDDLSLISGTHEKVEGIIRIEGPKAQWIQPAAQCSGEWIGHRAWEAGKISPAARGWV